MIKQAIIPLAGLGTRLLPITSVLPKELLPINGRPGLEYILDECISAGVKEFIFIISKKKINIKKYFFNDAYYKQIIKKKKDQRIKKEFLKLKKYQRMIKFVYQNNPKGTGDAVLKCKKYLKGDYFLLLLPDDLIIKKNCTKEMISLHKKTKSPIISTMHINRKNVSRWGIMSVKNKRKKYFQITDIIEKPTIKEAKSNYAVIGRYILPTNLLKELQKLKPGKGGEVHITDAIRNFISKGKKFYANIFSGEYLDCGTLNGYTNSTIKMAKDS